MIEDVEKQKKINRRQDKENQIILDNVDDEVEQEIRDSYRNKVWEGQRIRNSNKCGAKYCECTGACFEEADCE